jgi:hypothetical protein
MVKKTSFLLFLAFFVTRAFSQSDTLVPRVGARIPCKITEIGEEEIKYKKADNPDGPTYSTSKNKLKEMIFANGTREFIKSDELALDGKSTPELLSETRVIKVEPFSPFLNHICVGYEQMLKVGTNLEVKLGFVSSNLNSNLHQVFYSSTGLTGGYAKAGVKFLLGQDFVMRGIKYAHPLKGRFIRLDVDFVALNFQGLKNGYYNGYGSLYTMQTSDMSAYSYGLFISYGRQFVLGDIITLDYYVGLGASGQSLTFTKPNFNNVPGFPNYYRQDYTGNYYSHYRTPSGFSAQFGLSLGYIVKKKPASESRPRPTGVSPK